MKKILAVAVLSAIVSAPVLAADPGFYVGGSVGQSNTSQENAALTKKSDTAFSFLGGYNINQDLAIEIQYADLGKVTEVGGARANITTFAITAVVSMPINTDVSIYGKLGFANTVFEYATSNRTSASRNTATLGLGGLYNMNPNLGIRFGWDRYAVGDAIAVPDGNANLIYAGVIFKF